MTYCNLNNAKKIWKDNILQKKNINKRKYIVVPNPGKPFERTLPLKTILKLNNLENKDIFVNDCIVKDLKYPVSYLDYLQVKGQTYLVDLVKIGKKTKCKLINVKDRKYYPVRRWYLDKGKCKVLTLQGKIFTFEKDKELFESLKTLTLVICKEKEGLKLINALKSKCFHLSKLTGKDQYVNYEVINFSKEDSFIQLDLKGHVEKKVKIHKEDFLKKYVWKIINHDIEVI